MTDQDKETPPVYRIARRAVNRYEAVKQIREGSSVSTDQDKETRDRLFEAVQRAAGAQAYDGMTQGRYLALTKALQDLRAHIDGKPTQCCGRCEWFSAVRDCSGMGSCGAIVPISLKEVARQRVAHTDGKDCPCFKERG